MRQSGLWRFGAGEVFASVASPFLFFFSQDGHMNELKIFEKAEFGAVRVVMKDNEPWFVARDVAQALGYSVPQKAIVDHCKRAELFKCSEMELLIESPRGINIIPESDVYRLIMRSKLPTAEKFQDWVVEEVLPAIRKTGQYALPADPIEQCRELAKLYLEKAELLEEKNLAIAQRDYYKRTKAEIGSRREATSMATASAAVRKANELANRIGEGTTFKAVKAIPWLLNVFYASKGMYSAVGKKLKRISLECGYPISEIQDSTYGRINAYHICAIDTLRERLQYNPDMLDRYRRPGYAG